MIEVKRVLVMGYNASELGIFSPKHPGIAIIKRAIRNHIDALLEEGLEWVIISGQWGVELWAGEAVLELKKIRKELRLAVITPFLEQEEKWPEPKQAAYRDVLRQADYVNSVSKSKYAGPWQFKAKNHFLLRNSDGLILLYDEEKEGSPKFIRQLALREAEHRDYRILSISENDLQNLAEEALMEQYDRNG